MTRRSGEEASLGDILGARSEKELLKGNIVAALKYIYIHIYIYIM